MHQIDKALSKRGNRIVSIVDPIIAEKREATAFLSGMLMGATIAAQEPQRETESAWASTIRFLLVMAILIAVAGVCTAIGWHTADARWEAKAIAPIMAMKQAGELPPPIPQIGEYDMIKGIRK